MRRIPVVATIRDAYVFAFTQLGGVIGLIWVSMVMITIAQYFTFRRLYNDYIEFLASNADPAQMGPTLLMLLAYVVAALLLYAVMCVAVVQLVMGSRTAPAIVHFAFGPLEWRMFRAFLTFVGLLLGFCLFVEVIVDAVATQVPAAAQEPGKAATALAACVIGAILSVRLLLLLPAIAVNESGPAIRRAWALSAGNFFPLLGVLIGLFLPLVLAFVLIDLGMEGRPAVSPGASQQVQMVAALVQARKSLPWSCGLSFFFSPLLIGLFAGASVSVWRALKDEPVLDIAV
jgi:hypothetical protein